MNPPMPSTEELMILADAKDHAAPVTVGHAALGAYAVAEDYTQRQQAMAAEGSLIGAQVAGEFSSQHQAEADEQLSTIGASLRQVKGRAKAELNKYFAAAWRGNSDAPQQPDHVAALAANSGHLKSFLTWHERHIVALQASPTFRGIVEKDKSQHLQATAWGVANGWLSPSILSSDRAVQAANVYIGDAWSTFLQGRMGYHSFGGHNIVVAQAVGRTNDERYEDMVEKVHTAAGHEYIHLQLDGNRMGSWLPRWLKEGRAEHLNLALDDLTDQGFDAIDPDQRKELGLEERRIYYDERKLIATLLQAGREPIDSQTFTLAVSSNGPNSVQWFALTQALDYSWDMDNVEGWVTNLVKEQEDMARTKDTRLATADDRTKARIELEIQMKATEEVREIVADYARDHFHVTKKPQHHVGAAAVSGTAA